MKIVSKGELSTLSSSMIHNLGNLDGFKKDIITMLQKVENYDGINLSSAAKIIINNLDVVTKDLEITMKNINNYANAINEFDVNDFDRGVEGYLANVDGTTYTLPSGLGNRFSYMAWQMIKANSPQLTLKNTAGMNFDEEGFGKIGDRYVVATTTTFGEVGDYIDVVQADGSVLKCVIGDIKKPTDPGCNKWGHSNGRNVIEFVVDGKSWYGKKDNPGTPSNHPEWNQYISEVVNKGNYFTLSEKYDTSATPDENNIQLPSADAYVASNALTSPDSTTSKDSSDESMLLTSAPRREAAPKTAPSYTAAPQSPKSGNILTQSPNSTSTPKPSTQTPVQAPAQTPEAPLKKSIEEIANDVILGKYDNSTKRVELLTAAGYDPKEVQDKVNEILSSKIV